MTKLEIRSLKSHYLARWAVMRHNQKNSKKIVLLEDQFVLKNLSQGSTICYNCLGEMYQDIIENLSVTPTAKYNNLVLINNVEFKYKTVDEINQWVLDLATQVLVPGGRIIMSINHKFLVYNRIEISTDTLVQTWTKNFNQFRPVKTLNLLGKSQHGYGDYFFCLDYTVK